MARKPPSLTTVKKLFAFSGNLCAFPDCKNKLIEDDVVLGEICHIEAAEENGPRYNIKSDDEYRRSFDNLLLLCEKCHKKVDSDENLYPVAKLTSWKAQHEKKYMGSSIEIDDDLVDQSIKKFMQQNNVNNDSGTQIIEAGPSRTV